LKWSQPLVTSLQVTYVICPVLSPPHSRTAYQTRCEVLMSHLQLLCEHHALYDTYTTYNSYSKCHTFRQKLPDVPIPNITTVYNHMKRFQATNWNESFWCTHSKHNNSSQLHEKVSGSQFYPRQQENMQKTCAEENWTELVLERRYLKENHWLNLHGKWACLHHQQEIH
jgi:hypothetical protein